MVKGTGRVRVRALNRAWGILYEFYIDLHCMYNLCVLVLVDVHYMHNFPYRVIRSVGKQVDIY